MPYPRYYKIQGNYQDVSRNLNKNKAELNIKELRFKEAVDIYLKDLNRGRFLPTQDYTVDDLISTWLGDNVSRKYNQGDMDASRFYLFYLNFCQTGKNFPKEGTNRTDDQVSRDNYLHPNNRMDVSFAYFDDKGIPCAVGITVSKLDPSLWNIAIIRNTTADPAERNMINLCHEDIIDDPINYNEVEIKNINQSIKQELGSEHIIKLLSGIISEDGKIDINKCNHIEDEIKYVPSHVSPNSSIDLSQEFLLKMSRIDALSKRKNETIEKIFSKTEMYNEFLEKKEQLKIEYEAENNRLLTIRAEHIVEIEDEFKKKIKQKNIQLEKTANPALDKKIKQSFMAKNANTFSFMALGILATIGLSLILLAVFAPAALAGPVIGGLIIGAGIRKIRKNEKELNQYINLRQKALENFQNEAAQLKLKKEKNINEKADEIKPALEKLKMNYEKAIIDLEKEYHSKDERIVKLENEFEKSVKEILAQKNQMSPWEKSKNHFNAPKEDLKEDSGKHAEIDYKLELANYRKKTIIEEGTKTESEEDETPKIH